MKTMIFSSALLLGILGVGQSGALVEGASGGDTYASGGGIYLGPWIGYLPDLYVSSISKLDYGSHVAVGFTVRNGGLSASGSFKVRVTSPSSSSDISYSGLGAGQSRFLWLWLKKPVRTRSATYTLFVDSEYQVGESKEWNNTASFSVP